MYIVCLFVCDSMYIFSCSGIVHSVAKEASIISVRVLHNGEMGYSEIMSVCAAVLNKKICISISGSSSESEA